MRGGARVGFLIATLLVFCAVAAGCKSDGGNPRRPLQVPNQVSGGTRGGGRPEQPNAQRQREDEKLAQETASQKAEAEKTSKSETAERLWTQAQATTNPSAAASLYKTIADDHKDSPHAEQARYLEAVNEFQIGAMTQVVAALDQYMKDYPVNPHLPDVERMLYEASLAVFNNARGFRGIFKSDQKGYDGLNSIVERFPEGRYADDALMALGDEYTRKDDLANAALQYRNLLLRYPDSEWSFKARLKLADTYLARDNGTPYNAGYVDIDPRGPTSPQYAAGRPVKSCVQAALENYQTFVDRIAADPARRPEYASEVAYAKGQVQECRRRIAGKDRSIASFYASRGQGEAASAYDRFASNVENGRAWSEGTSAGRSSPTTTTTAPAGTRPVSVPPPSIPPPPAFPPAAPPPGAIPPPPSLPPEGTPPPAPAPETPPPDDEPLPPPRHIPGDAVPPR